MLFWWSETSEPSVPLRAWPWIRPINQPEGPVCVPVSRVLGWGRGSILMEIDNEKVRKHWEGFWWEAGTWIHSPIWKDKNTKRKVERPGSASKCFKWWRVRGWMVDWRWWMTYFVSRVHTAGGFCCLDVLNTLVFGWFFKRNAYLKFESEVHLS